MYIVARHESILMSAGHSFVVFLVSNDWLIDLLSNMHSITDCCLIRIGLRYCYLWLMQWCKQDYFQDQDFLRATAVPAGTAEARISHGNSVCLSVRLSVTTRWYTKLRWDRDSGSPPYDSLGSLVSNEVIWCRWVRRFPSNEGIKLFYHYWLIWRENGCI